MGMSQCPGCGVKINTSAYAAFQQPQAPAPAPAAPASTPAPAPTAAQAHAPQAPAQGNSSFGAIPPRQAAPQQMPAGQVQPGVAQASAPGATNFTPGFSNAGTQPASTLDNVMSSQEMQKAKAHAHRFLSWLVASWKRPTQALDVPKWYGVISFALQAFIISFMYFISIDGAISAQSRTVSSVNNSLSLPFNNAINNVTARAHGVFLEVMIKFFLLMLVCDLVFIACSYLAYRLTHSEQMGFLNYITKIAQYCNLNFLFACIAFVLNFLSPVMVGILLFILYYPLLYIAAIATVAKDSEDSKADTMHVVYILIIAGFVVGFIGLMSALGIMAGAAGNMVQNAPGDFMRALTLH